MEFSKQPQPVPPQVQRAQHKFTLVNAEPVPEVQGVAKFYRHQNGGPEVLSISNGDIKKAFAIAFRTVPTDSTGLWHILEHSAVQGSQHFPLRNIISRLKNESLSTNLSASTGVDHTLYSGASTDSKDFTNTFSIYLDAVFAPLLRPEVFLQEGWRLEIDGDGVLSLNGVVFNEMKGSLQERDTLRYDLYKRTTFKGSHLDHASGGDPLKIPDLTHRRLVEEHKRVYRPENARIIVWGNHDDEEILTLVEKYIRPAGAPLAPEPVETPLPDLSRQINRRTVAEYPVTPGAHSGAVVAATWRLDSPISHCEYFALRIATYLLNEDLNEELRKRSLGSKINRDLRSEDSVHTFNVWATEVDPENIDAVYALFQERLVRTITEGFDPIQVASEVKAWEFALRKQSKDDGDFGIKTIENSLTRWSRGQDPLKVIRFEEAMKDLNSILKKDPNYLEGLIASKLRDNNQYVEMVLLPSAQEGQRVSNRYQELAARLQNHLPPEAIDKIRADSKALRAFQEASDDPEAIERFPRIDCSEAAGPVLHPESYAHVVSGGEIIEHPVSTDGVVYLTLAGSLPELKQEDLPYAKIVGSLLFKLGTMTENVRSFTKRQGFVRGEFSSDLVIMPEAGGRKGRPFLQLSGVTHTEDAENLLGIFRDGIYRANVRNTDRLLPAVKAYIQNLRTKFLDEGDTYAVYHGQAQLGQAAAMRNQISGIDAVACFQAVAEILKSDPKSVSNKCEEILAQMQSPGFLRGVVTGDPSSLDTIRKGAATLFNARGHTDMPLAAPPISDRPSYHGIILGGEVSSVAQVIRLPENARWSRGLLEFACALITSKHIHHEVRRKGGAYGCGLYYTAMRGELCAYSASDPNPSRTIDVFAGLADAFERMDLSNTELNRVKIGALKSVDQYRSVRGWHDELFARSIYGIKKAEIQRAKDQILGASLEEIRSLGKMVREAAKNQSIVVAGPEKVVDAWAWSLNAAVKIHHPLS